MTAKTGLRDRKRAQTRRRIAETAAGLFASRGYDAVSVAEVAEAAEVSDQTVYNYFPAKQDLVLDRSEEIRELFARTVRERPPGVSPAGALRVIAREDIQRYRTADRDRARGEFPALCVASPGIRRFALEARDQQADAVAAVIAGTSPGGCPGNCPGNQPGNQPGNWPAIDPAVARAHAAALISVFQLIADRIGYSVLDGADPRAVADDLDRSADAVFDDLDAHFRAISRSA